MRIAALLVALVAVLAPATAQAVFGPSMFLSNPNRDAFEPQVAIDGNGNALAVWTAFDGSNDRVQARVRSANGTLGFVLPLSAAGRDAFSPQVAVNAAGMGIAIWTRFDGTNDRIEARTISSAGLGPVLPLSAAGRDAEEPQVAIDANGNALAVWERFDGANFRIQARRISAAGVLGPVQTLSGAGRDAFEPQVALDGNGNAFVVWTRFDGANFRIQARQRSAAGALGFVLPLSDAGQDAGAPQISVNANGNAVAVWTRFDGANDRIQARALSTASGLSPVQTLSAAGRNAFEPQVGVDANGNAYAVWTRNDGTNGRVQARVRSASGALGFVLPLSAGGQDAFEPQIAVNPSGNAVAVWERFDGTQFRIQARTLSAAGGLGAVQDISPTGQDAFSPQVAINGAGAAFADWTRFSGGSNSRIQAAAGP